MLIGCFMNPFLCAVIAWSWKLSPAACSVMSPPLQPVQVERSTACVDGSSLLMAGLHLNYGTSINVSSMLGIARLRLESDCGDVITGPEVSMADDVSSEGKRGTRRASIRSERRPGSGGSGGSAAICALKSHVYFSPNTDPLVCAAICATLGFS
ncbi:hypothetical protein V6N12_010316 [Hibiscus sabdariffa]|uniref:Uncharacterized protein n=1 Tax=Hibiscus sabdariffa TaxID=183260 RepID=A0ABR1ZZI9_9ROSI